MTSTSQTYETSIVMPLLNKRLLRNEYELLYLNYHRNKNQQKSSQWFKYLNILVRHLRKLLMADSVERQKRIGYHVTSHIIPRAYYAFHGIIAQGQFIALGFVLVGSAAKVRSLINEAIGETSDSPIIKKLSGKPTADKTPVSDQDIGEELEWTAPISEKTSVADSKQRPLQNVGSGKHKIRKKVKKKSAIDDIFG